MKFKQHPERRLRHAVSAPFIYGMIVPSIIFDISLEIYQNITFPMYGLEKVERGNYIRIDRQKLSKLKPMEKVNCMYCGYVNGLVAYSVEVAARTEQYWCGIKHEGGEGYIEPKHHKDFVDYEKMK